MGLRCDEVGHILRVVGDNYICDRCKGWMPKTGGKWHEYKESTLKKPVTDTKPKSPPTSKSVSPTPSKRYPEPEWPGWLRSYKDYSDDQLRDGILKLLDHPSYKEDGYTDIALDIAGKSYRLSPKQRIALATHLKMHEKDFK